MSCTNTSPLTKHQVLASRLAILKQQSLLSTTLPRPTQTLQFNSNGTACACISSSSSCSSRGPLNHTATHPPTPPSTHPLKQTRQPWDETTPRSFNQPDSSAGGGRSHLLRCFNVFGGNSFQFQISEKTKRRWAESPNERTATYLEQTPASDGLFTHVTLFFFFFSSLKRGNMDKQTPVILNFASTYLLLFF